ncbi:MAG TPA: lysylphosphatidylglycerol synthase transmembrane domain-containing protein [Planctomycetota bacterium]|nr:lysylphosphatidylglycerol synthase transmembrane domain-containing protein [Planctomycetota bacterium]
MSPSVRRWVLNLLRVAVTVVAGIVVVRMIRWDDYWAVKEPGGKVATYPLDQVRAVTRVSDTEIRVDWANGRQSRAEDARKREGFLSLFDHTNKPLFFGMMLAILLPFSLLALRWWLLLRGHGFQARFGQIFFVTYAGAFFNNFLPGAVGGDLTKAILASSGEERKAAIAATVILDRLIGLAVMIVLGSACLTPYVGRFDDKRLAYLIYGLLGAMVVGYVLYFSPLFRKILEVLPFKKTIAELDGVFRAAREKKALVAQAGGLSLVAQAAGILIIYGLARAMGIPGIGLWMFFIFEPIIFIVTALPISMGGWGVQEVIYEKTFGTFGGIDPNQAIALSVLYKLSLILVSIPGGLAFAMGATQRRQAGPPPA